MSGKELRELFNPDVVRDLAERIKASYPKFPSDRFRTEINADLPALGLLERSRRIMQGLHEHLPKDYRTALSILMGSLGAGEGSPEEAGEFRFLPFLNYVSTYGLHEPDASLNALYRMTRYFSAEFDIRPFILHHPERTMRALSEWAKDDDWRVRRLASEGTRPRLPWGIRLQPFVKNPTPVIAILDRLHNDPHLVVRRSVANNLNDISKDHTDLAVEVARRWWETGHQGSRWAVRHGLRTLVKKGHPAALNLLGFTGGNALTLSAFRLEHSDIGLGDELAFSFSLNSAEESHATLSIDYAIHHRKQNGKLTPKVFKLTKRTLAPGESIDIARRHSIVPITTRTYYAGLHQIEILVNGRSLGTQDFTLRLRD